MIKKKFKVKLTFPYKWPLMRQTPNWSGIWGDYEFLIDDSLNECDFWIVFSKHELKKEFVRCPPENIILLTWEPFSIEQFSEMFLKQFALVITTQREINHQNVKFNLCGHPWFVGKSYDELMAMKPIEKTKKISVITSNKVLTDGHKKRLEFVYKLKDYFKDEMDLFGRGINDFNDKWDVLATYKYSITIENSKQNDYLTEKFFDCHLAFTYPLYYGCPNAEKYFSPNSFSRIDIEDFHGSVKALETILGNNSHYQNHLQYILPERIKILNTYNLFPMLVSYMEGLDVNAKHKDVCISPEPFMIKYFRHLKRILN